MEVFVRKLKMSLGQLLRFAIQVSLVVFEKIVIRLFGANSIKGFGFLIRCIPCSKIRKLYVEFSKTLRNHKIDFTFFSRALDVHWSAKAFPDLMTRHMLFEGMYQQDVLVALQNLIRKGDIIFDVGGHHGLMTLISSKATGEQGKVITFEPNPLARRFLIENLLINNIHNVTIEEIALSDNDGTATLFIQEGEVSWNSTIVREFSESMNFSDKSICVETMTLDNYVKNSCCVPWLIKIDVEGSEFFVINGAIDTFKKYRPILIMEFNPLSAQAAGHDISDYIGFFETQLYKMVVIKRDKFSNFNFKNCEAFDKNKHIEGDELANIVCVPMEISHVLTSW